MHIKYLCPCHKEGYADAPLLPPTQKWPSSHKRWGCTESNEKSYFIFLVFELLAAKELPIRPQKKIFVQKWPNLDGRLELI